MGIRNYAIALGNFDGIHLGHRKVIENAIKYEKNSYISCVLSFQTHTLGVLDMKAPSQLLTDDLRSEIYNEMGVSKSVKLDFREIRNLSPEEFIRDILVKEFNAKAVSCGFNYRFGKNGAGDVQILKQLAKKYDLQVKVAQAVDFEGLPISSTRIRQAIKHGDILKANAMLARPFSYDFAVSVGDRRGGAVLGFPTINQEFPDDFINPRFGVYVGRAFVEGKSYPTVVNFGIRPTFGTPKPRSESHLIGFSGDLYGKKIKVELLDFIRPEIKFNGIDGLIQQINKDVITAEKFFNSIGKCTNGKY